MAEEEDKQEEKFDFTAEGEALGYINLEQARLQAMEHARDNTEFYGSTYDGVRLVWEVLSAEDGEDYYEIKLSFRPSGRFRGEPGIEQLIFDKTGALRMRQMLDEPSGMDELPNGTSTPSVVSPDATEDRPTTTIPTGSTTTTPAPTPAHSPPISPPSPSRTPQPLSPTSSSARGRATSSPTPPQRPPPGVTPKRPIRRLGGGTAALMWAIVSIFLGVVATTVLYVAGFLGVGGIVRENSGELYAAGNEQYQQGDYVDAVTSYSESLRFDQSAPTFYNRGLVHARLRQYQQAVEDFSEAIRLNGEHAEAYFNRGLAFRSLGKDADANRDIQTANDLRRRN